MFVSFPIFIDTNCFIFLKQKSSITKAAFLDWRFQFQKNEKWRSNRQAHVWFALFRSTWGCHWNSVRRFQTALGSQGVTCPVAPEHETRTTTSKKNQKKKKKKTLLTRASWRTIRSLSLDGSFKQRLKKTNPPHKLYSFIGLIPGWFFVNYPNSLQGSKCSYTSMGSIAAVSTCPESVISIRSGTWTLVHSHIVLFYLLEAIIVEKTSKQLFQKLYSDASQSFIWHSQCILKDTWWF